MSMNCNVNACRFLRQPFILVLQRGASLLLLTFHFAAPALVAQSPNANEIIRRTEQGLRAKTQQGTVSMTVSTPDWQRTLNMGYWAVNPDKTFLRITAPAKEAGTSTSTTGKQHVELSAVGRARDQDTPLSHAAILDGKRLHQ